MTQNDIETLKEKASDKISTIIDTAYQIGMGDGKESLQDTIEQLSKENELLKKNAESIKRIISEMEQE